MLLVEVEDRLLELAPRVLQQFLFSAELELFSSTTRLIFILHRRTFHRTVRTKDAAVARLRAQQRFAVRALVEKLACVGRHRFSLSEAANGAYEHGFKKNFVHSRFSCGQRKDSPHLQSLWLAQRDSLYQDQTKRWQFSYRNPLSHPLPQALFLVLS
jgi:hypothetical protein